MAVWRGKVGNRYLVDVYCYWGKKSPSEMKHEVSFRNRRWIIMNIHYYENEKGKLVVG
ncbi:MAG: hypothetical protein AB1757_21670 [Acidobacteriota bacterium]